jgi:hypothetical protein
MPDRLYFTDSDESNRLIAADPMALVIGFALDQQITVQKAFSGPLALRERLGSLDAATLAAADLEPVFRTLRRSTVIPGRWQSAYATWRHTSATNTTALRSVDWPSGESYALLVSQGHHRDC